MSEKKKQQFTQKRLRELEKQVQEYTDEDLLNEADELEKEMLAGNITYDLPDDFFQQILAKGKLIEAERDRNKQKPVDQDVEKEDETRIKRVWDETVPPEAELINIPVMTITPPSEQPTITGDAAGKPEEKADLSHATNIVTAVESAPEQEMVRADIADADKVKIEVPRAAAQKNETAAGEAGGQGNGKGSKKPRRGVKLRWKVLMTVMILVMVPLAAGITSGGKKHYKLEVQEQNSEKGHRISFSNDGFTEDIFDDEMIAYDEIEKQIGIDAIRIGDRPSDLLFDSYVITGPRADILFKCDNNKTLILTEIMSVEKTKADYISDATNERITSVYNEWLEMDINIYKEKLGINKIKYYAVIVIDNSIYNITSTINLKDFKFILEDLNF